jgi:hypothetical protein
MATTTDEPLLPGRKAKYPWSEWTDGRVWILKQGEDFDVSPLAMRSLIYTRATKNGMSATTRVRGEELRFQFHRPVLVESPLPVKKTKVVRKPKPRPRKAH